MADIERLIQERIREALDQQRQQRSGVFDELGQIKNILGGGGGYQPGPSVYGQMAQPPAGGGGGSGGMAGPTAAPPSGPTSPMSPEDYEYYVDIEKRDVFGDPKIDPETGEEIPAKPIGWDKAVKRYAKRARTEEAREPSLGDLSSDGMKQRDSRGRFTKKMKDQGEMGGVFGDWG